MQWQQRQQHNDTKDNNNNIDNNEAIGNLWFAPLAFIAVPRFQSNAMKYCVCGFLWYHFMEVSSIGKGKVDTIDYGIVKVTTETL